MRRSGASKTAEGGKRVHFEVTYTEGMSKSNAPIEVKLSLYLKHAVSSKIAQIQNYGVNVVLGKERRELQIEISGPKPLVKHLYIYALK